MRLTHLQTLSSSISRSLGQCRHYAVFFDKGAKAEGEKYIAQGSDPKHVPSRRGEFQTHKAILEKIGRGTEAFADKFTDWRSFFTASSAKMGQMGIPIKQRKWILNWREWYKRGRDPVHIPIPKRQKHYLKIRAQVEEARLKKKGLSS